MDQQQQLEMAQKMATMVSLGGAAVGILVIASMWKMFVKANKPGWAAIVPIYNLIVMLEIIDRPVWWIVLMLIPFVNFVVGIILILDLAKAYGKSGGFAVGMLFLPFIFYPMLGFGNAEYVGVQR